MVWGPISIVQWYMDCKGMLFLIVSKPLKNPENPFQTCKSTLQVCAYIYIYMCVYIYMYVYVYVCMYLCMYTCIYVCIYVCMYACMFVCMYEGWRVFQAHFLGTRIGYIAHTRNFSDIWVALSCMEACHSFALSDVCVSFIGRKENRGLRNSNNAICISLATWNACALPCALTYRE